MKKILGLDLGTASIGWALVNEAEQADEKSSIIKSGVRIISLTTDELSNFESGKSFSVNQERTVSRGARRSLQRYKLRRNFLIQALQKQGLINESTHLSETGKGSTHELWQLRAAAAEQQISLEDFARVLLAINKKRGYKSNRKAKGDDEGQVIDGMKIAKKLYEDNLTPGQYVLSTLSEENKYIPDFYPSDLQNEFDKIWNFQQQFYPSQLTSELKSNLQGKNKSATWAILKEPFSLEGTKLRDKENKEIKGFDKKVELYRLRTIALSEQLNPELLAIVLQEINAEISKTSGYLGAISDRSKSLYFNKQTVGQASYQQLLSNPHTKLKGHAFYRQDYLDEFETVWEKQAEFYSILADNDFKASIRDCIIFYQRPLRSQKGLISTCTLEGKTQEIKCKRTGKIKKKLVGPRVIAKSNLLFQEFKIWQILNNLEIRHKLNKEKARIGDIDADLSKRQEIAKELNIKKNLTANQVLKLLVDKPSDWELNYKDGVEGNSTNELLYKAYQEIIELTNQSVDFKKSADILNKQLATAFDDLGINSKILYFDDSLEGQDIEQQPAWQLWHLLYSYEGDKSATGNESLYKKLEQKFGFKQEYAKILGNINLPSDYGGLSARAIRKILPYLKAGNDYATACAYAGYNHSNYQTKEENDKRILKDKLEILPKNSLRNPVVEKILNQMVNVVNAIVEEYGKPDEIRIELARELKQSAKEREETTKNINAATKNHEAIREKIAQLPQFRGGVRITRNDIIRYKLWQELINNGHKTLYSNTYIAEEEIFSKRFDIEHIIPKALIYDDSFSNKTLELADVNRKKSSQTAYDFMQEQSMTVLKDVDSYEQCINSLFDGGKGKISKAKRNKLLMAAHEIQDGFIERDLRNTQYIAKKAQEMLKELVRDIVPTTGKITDKLREDWQLINVLKELNFPIYHTLGLTHEELTKDGQKIKQITDWTKRNDQRHHAMDALTVAFTKRAHIQYINHRNARKKEYVKTKQPQAKIYILGGGGEAMSSQDLYQHIYAIEQKNTYYDEAQKKRLIKPPMPIAELRQAFKDELQSILISYKAKNKVVTTNINITKTKKGKHQQKISTPRGQLHKETVYGKSQVYVAKQEKVGTKFDIEKISLVSNQAHREVLTKRLAEFDNNPQKAFGDKNSPSKNPIYIDAEQTQQLPEKVKLSWLENHYTIKKPINKELKIDKVIDKGIQKILQARLEEHGGNADKAFSNLADNPIWLTAPKPQSEWEDINNPKPHELGIAIKTVKITGVSNAEPLHYKRDANAEHILDSHGDRTPTDYVSTGNNHHVAIYEDEQGNWQERVVSLFHAVGAVNNGQSAVDTSYKQAQGWKFLFTMKTNEMFIFANEQTGFNPHQVDLLDAANYHLISPNLYRVQKLAASGQFDFRHHLETVVQRRDSKNKTIDEKPLRDIIWKRFQSMSSLKESMSIKVRTNHLGEIVQVGEY